MHEEKKNFSREIYNKVNVFGTSSESELKIFVYCDIPISKSASFSVLDV
jgi:hypothetical protein